MNHIIGLEGPAGSGKSTLYSWLKDKLGDKVLGLDRPSFPRFQGPNIGSWSSSYLEYMALSAAMMLEKDILVDRFLLSRWVYKAIERGSISTSFSNREMQYSYNNLLEAAIGDYWVRADRIPAEPKTLILLLLPSLATIEEYRKISGKEYPMSAVDEYNYYSALYHAFDVPSVRIMRLDESYIYEPMRILHIAEAWLYM